MLGPYRQPAPRTPSPKPAPPPAPDDDPDDFVPCSRFVPESERYSEQRPALWRQFLTIALLGGWIFAMAFLGTRRH